MLPNTPLSDISSVYIFGEHLRRFLVARKYELVFFNDNPMKEITWETPGRICFRTENDMENIFIISNVPYENFKNLAEQLGLVEKEECMFVSRPSR
jgi:hypothetical protein